MTPPEGYSELRRVAALDNFLSLKHWDDAELFKAISLKIRKKYNLTGLTISLVLSTKTLVKHETKLEFREVPRCVSLDSHCILSKDHFCLLDASKDWRTSKNPLVAGSPGIKFYCGVRLFCPKGEPIGVVAVFDTWARKACPEDLIRDLQVASREIMSILQTPYEEILTERKLLIEAHRRVKTATEIDEELKQLTRKLGRATSRSCATTVFEKDGSGNPYSQNHHFALKVGADNEDIASNCLEDAQRRSLVRMLCRVGSLRTASEMLCESLAATFKADFVFILEIRSAEHYSIASEYFPKGHVKIDAETFKHANKLVKSRRLVEDTDRVLTRVLGTHGANYSTVKSDHEFFVKAFLSDFGLHYVNPKHSTKFNSGCVMPFYRYNSKLIKKSSKLPDKNVVELYLRAGGFLVGIMNEASEKGRLSQATLSKIFDHTSVLRKLYIN